jgi:hypothetical protein
MAPHDEGDAAGTMTRAWGEAVQAFFREGERRLPELLAFYDPGVRFQDPIRTIDGLPAFAAMNRRFVQHVRAVDIEMGDIVEGGNVAFAAWTMRVTPRLGPEVVIDGVTHLRFVSGSIVAQRDCFDLAGSIAASLPLGGPIYRALAGALG